MNEHRACQTLRKPDQAVTLRHGQCGIDHQYADVSTAMSFCQVEDAALEPGIIKYPWVKVAAEYVETESCLFCK